MWTNAALLSLCVISMPIVRMLADLICAIAKLDLLETDKLAPVNPALQYFKTQCLIRSR